MVELGIAHHRQVGSDAFDFLGDHVAVVRRPDGDIDAREPADLARPDTGTNGGAFAFYGALIGDHRLEPPVGDDEIGNGSVLDDLRPLHARAFGQRHGHVGRTDQAVRRDPDRAIEVVRVHQREFFLGLLGPDQAHLEPEGARRRDGALVLRAAFLPGADAHAAGLAPAGRLAGLIFQLGNHAHGVGREVHQIVVGPVLGDGAGGVPGGAGGELVPLDQHHVRAAVVGKVVGGGAAHHAATDDDDFRLIGKFLGHGWSPRRVGCACKPSDRAPT